MKQSGFTLIELLVVVAIMSILAAIAVPAYTRYVAVAEIKTAQSDLELLSVALENRYQRVLSYPAVANQNTAALQTVLPQWTPYSDVTKFNFANVNPNAANYTLTATGLIGSYQNCVVTMTSGGAKTITNCNQLAEDGSWL